MQCPKCQGLLYQEGEQARCLNCGKIVMSEPKLAALPSGKMPPLPDAVKQKISESVRRAKANDRAKGTVCRWRSKGGCPVEAARDSVYCPDHRDQKKRLNQRYKLGLNEPVISRKRGRPKKQAAISSNGHARHPSIDQAIRELDAQIEQFTKKKTVLGAARLILQGKA